MNSAHQLETPVVFVIFNRPDATQRVFEAIRKQRPRHLYVAADGPRANTPGEAEKCQAARDIVNQIDWDCEVKTLFRDTNLGCGKAVSSAISWFFEQVEEGIILEDDCLPCEEFFLFCEDLLARYRYDDDVMSIGGTNFLKGAKRGKSSYYFSSHFHVWGWASWKRAWDRYDYEAKDMTKEGLRAVLDRRFISSGEKRLFENMFRDMKADRVDTWDYQWLFTHLFRDGLTIIPNANLVTNIGPSGTHFTNTHEENPLINLPTGTVFPLVPNDDKTPDKEADLLLYRLNFKQSTMKQLARRTVNAATLLYKKVLQGQ